MAILCCSSIHKCRIIASASPENTTPSLNSHQNINFHTISTTKNSSPQKIQLENREQLQQDRKKLKRRNRSSILEIERAIGSGIFRDSDGESDGKSRLFDNLLGNTVGKSEGSAEKKLRETGEWLVDQTERTSRSAGKQILMTMFLWILPMWIVAFLVVSGVVQLPFTTPFLEDVIS
ncbi:probable NAD(P)H dehydrogenase subunit CRR3, chloroplastic [Primulina huaijiensis]|uniref:probable NAD(P)H dehydrogenase subunit CRR3, chloroplastic n=1 Tax=Primulina huaijiensis TaxID=1492673 RepID=UPI003CC730C0